MEEAGSHVVDRRGFRVPVRFDAITDRNAVLCSAAYGRHLATVEPLLPAVTQAVVCRFRNGMSTHELDMLTAEVCAAQAGRHRDYSDLAARIYVSDLHKRTDAAMRSVVDRLSSGGSETRLHPEFVGIVARAGGVIDRRLDFTRDYRFNWFGLQTLARSYLLRVAGADGPVAERPQHAYMRVALAICVGQADKRGHEAPESIFQERLERAFEVYELLSTHRLTHATPTMFNAGTKRPQLSSCFLLGVDDALDVLLQVDKDAGLISKWAGGVGIGLTPIRAEGALVRSSGGQSGGVRRYVAKLNGGQVFVNQGGLRPGAYAVYLETWHADVFAFLEAGRHTGGSGNAPDLKYALWVNDMFMEALIAELEAPPGGGWHLFCPDRAPGLDRVHGAEFRALYSRYVAEGRHSRVVKASAVITEWFKTVAQKGNPYILFKDHINAKSNLSHLRTITHSNLCVSGATPVLTDAGHLPIGPLQGREVRVWNGSEWSAVTVCQTSAASPLVRVELDNGAALECSPGHLFYDHRGAPHPAGALRRGTRLEVARRWPVVEGGAPLEHPYARGLEAAAGLLSGGAPPVPFDAALVGRLRWLEGLCAGAAARFDAPGGGAPPSLRLEAAEPDGLLLVRLMLQTMGCDPRVSSSTAPLFRCAARARWRLSLGDADLRTLKGLGFAFPALSAGRPLAPPGGAEGAPPACSGAPPLPPPPPNKRPARVLSVTPVAAPAPTFCFTEPLRHRGVFGGVLTGQCAEITVPSFFAEGREHEAEYGTCNLAALPLASYVRPDARADNPGRVRVDWAALFAAAGAAVRNLDNVIDVSFYPVEPARRSNLAHRPVAVGVMGLADVFALFGYAYGSPRARALDRALHAAIYYGAMAASSALGAERGNFSSFEGSAAQRGLLQPDLWVLAGHLGAGWEAEVAATTGGALSADMWAGLRRACALHLRNAYVTADMPTATSSQVTGQNECFEPFTSNLYTRKTLAGEFILLNPHLLRELEDRGLWDETMQRELLAAAGSIQGFDRIPAGIRRRFKTARELDQRLLTLHAKARNPFLSQSQSLNYYFGEPVLKNILTVIVMGWREGLTTGSYYIHTQPAAGALKLPPPPPVVNVEGGGPAASSCLTSSCSACSA
jgi:ribonucleotide reductase alpha subunit